MVRHGEAMPRFVSPFFWKLNKQKYKAKGSLSFPLIVFPSEKPQASLI
jgi:hypothetical protein